MNKYTIITLLILSVILITILIAFNIEYKWWYFIPIYLISNYNGKVMKQTFQGFNINKISFKETTNETIQIFICDVVLGFTGKTIEFKGQFDKSIDMPIENLRIILYKFTNRNEIIKSLETGKPYSKIYKYRGDEIEIIFTEITQYKNS